MEGYGPYGHHEDQEDLKTEISVHNVLTLQQNTKVLIWLVLSLYFTGSVAMNFIALAQSVKADHNLICRCEETGYHVIVNRGKYWKYSSLTI